MDPIIPNGLPAPDFELYDLDGTLYRLAQARGRLLLLNFWSAECPWSERFDLEFQPDLETWGARLAMWNIAANANEPLDLLRQVARQRRLPVVLHDPGARVADLYRAKTTPHIFLLDEQGVLRYQGAVDDRTFRRRSASRFYLREALQALFAGRLPEPASTPPYGCTVVRYSEE